jgi:hypothetical protein
MQKHPSQLMNEGEGDGGREKDHAHAHNSHKLMPMKCTRYKWQIDYYHSHAEVEKMVLYF